MGKKLGEVSGITRGFCFQGLKMCILWFAWFYKLRRWRKKNASHLTFGRRWRRPLGITVVKKWSDSWKPTDDVPEGQTAVPSIRLWYFRSTNAAISSNCSMHSKSCSTLRAAVLRLCLSWRKSHSTPQCMFNFSSVACSMCSITSDVFAWLNRWLTDWQTN